MPQNCTHNKLHQSPHTKTAFNNNSHLERLLVQNSLLRLLILGNFFFCYFFLYHSLKTLKHKTHTSTLFFPMVNNNLVVVADFVFSLVQNLYSWPPPM